ncbi:site-2 protease family protein [Sphaerisporangium sp. TRM90804]|uniref:site-2 protease family protein n=1 Tax=Sphaerisporangium sp. TRM90804 TaxID=3031113 RepID=UPI00244C2787|nr:site-2 protease family protein [Sphaerisporangium sp. TRM90804]MDH2425464.1 site-2 protease family protein [Sphaerisporangium sp. TRM90804]
MKQSVRLGRVGGIAVGAHWSTLMIVALIAGALAGVVFPQDVPETSREWYWVAGVVTSLLFLASLLAHELAHAITARRRGVPVTGITLWLLGGVTEFSGEAKRPGDELRIAVAGPLTSLLLAVLLYPPLLLLPRPALTASAVQWLALMNAVLAGFNMLPGAPLDGGRVLHAVMWRRSGDRAAADRVAARAGQGLGLALLLIGGAQVVVFGWTAGLWTMLIGWFLSSAARNEGMVRAAWDGLTGLRVREVMTASPDIAPAWQDVDDFVAGMGLNSRQMVFPVVEFSGEPTAVVTLEGLAAIPAADRRDRRVGTVARPLPADHILSPDDDASRILTLRALPGGLLAVVRETGRVVGMVTSADLARAVQQGILRSSSRVPPPEARRNPDYAGGPDGEA